MKRSILYLFPVSSIISIIIAFLFPIVRYEGTPSSFYPFWIWGFPHFPWFEINLLDISQKVISLIIGSLMFLITSSLFLVRKYPNRLKVVSNIWQWSGIGILVLTIFWILSWNFVVPFFAPYGFAFEFIIVLPFVSGMLLIFGKIYAYIFSRKTKE